MNIVIPGAQHYTRQIEMFLSISGLKVPTRAKEQ